jgi:threonine synthase
MIRYRSTRGHAPSLSFTEVVMQGLAPDGGLYVPESLPFFSPPDIARLAGLGYPALAERILAPFIGDAVPQADLRHLLEETYGGFRHAGIAPLKQLDATHFLLELFHGPTLAFKDFALQCLGRLLEYFLKRGKRRLTVIGATSGDTGSAAIEACRGREQMRIFILHPEGRVSEVQRRQMTGVPDANVFNIAVDGTFDDCQDIVKALFADADFRESQGLTAVNSINWVRILAQTVYYFYAALALGAPMRQLAFSVPTGNFGDIYAGHIARGMGLPVEKLIIATNRNDILARALKSGLYETQDVLPTLSPSMDIQISSNFERLLFDLEDGDPQRMREDMRAFRQTGRLALGPRAWAKLRRVFDAASIDDAETKRTIGEVWANCGELLDPHTAVGLAAARQCHRSAHIPCVTLATAHPAKFPDAVEAASGIRPILPPHLSDLLTRPERLTRLPADPATIISFIEAQP